jgi:Flp pilus assembly protein TadD
MLTAVPSQAPTQASKTLVNLPARPGPAPLVCDSLSMGGPPSEEEIARLEGQAQRTPPDARVHTCLAHALFDAGRLAEAIREYREAISLDGNLLQAHRNLAYALLDRGHREATVKMLDRAVRLSPGDPALRVALRSALRAMDHHP